MKSRAQLFFNESSSFPERLREVRKKMKVTHRELSERAGLSINLLSLLERSKTSPSMHTFYSLADALGISPAELLEPYTEHIRFAIQRRDEHVTMVANHGRYYYKDAPFIPRAFHLQQMRPAHITLDKKHFTPFINNPIGDQLVFVLDGEIDYSYDNQPYRLKAGDALYFRGQLPRGPSKMYTDKAEYLIVFVSELFGWLELSIDRLGRLRLPPQTPEGLSRYQRIAWRVRYARYQTGSTQSGLSAAAGLSRATVGHIECGRTIPTLQTLTQIARALNVPVLYFFDQEGCPQLVCHVPAKKRKYTQLKTPDCQSTTFLQDNFGSPMFNAELRRFDQKTFTPCIRRKEGQRYMLVLRGRIELSHDGEEHILKKGDGVYFDASFPYGIRQLQTKTAEVIWCSSMLRVNI